MAKRSKNKRTDNDRISGHVGESGFPAFFSGSRRDWVLGTILVLTVLAVYSPVWRAGYIWDDDKYIYANPVLVGPLGLMDIWTSKAADSCPVTMTTWWAEHALWGLLPLPYHIVNVFLQAACGLVLWRALIRLMVPGAWLGAALWTLHPMQVESGAWISEMKNTESGLFFLLSVLFFVRWLRPDNSQVKVRGDRNYAFTLIFAALAMGSKSSTVILPVVLCLCRWWMEGRWSWRVVARTIPVFIMSVISSALAIWIFKLQLNSDPLAARGWPERLVDTGLAVWFYLGKLIWPHPLSAIYPAWNTNVHDWLSWVPLVGVVILLGILWLKRKSKLRPCFFAFAYFLIALFPVLGLINQSFVHYSVVADHLQYLAGIGPLALIGAGLARLGDFAVPGRVWVQRGVAAGLFFILGLLSWQQAWKYENQRTLWTDNLDRNPDSFVVIINLGNALVSERKLIEAQAQYLKALVIDPNSAQAHSNLAGAFLLQGKLDEAIAEYQKALEIDPSRAHSEADLAYALNFKGKVKEALEHYQKSLALNPRNAETHFNYAQILHQRGHVDEAATQYQDALAIKPGYAEAHYNLGSILLQKGDVDAAIAEYQSALACRPNYAEVHNNLGAALMRKGQLGEAIAQFEEAIREKPDFSEAQKNLTAVQALLVQPAGPGK